MPAMRLRILLLAVQPLFTMPATARWDPREKAEMEHQAAETVRLFRKREPGPQAFFDRAAGRAVLPTVGKGGADGEGMLYAGGKVTG